MIHNNNKKLFVLLSLILFILIFQIIDYKKQSVYLQSYCQYGFLNKMKQRQQALQIDCFTCYNFNQFADQYGQVELLFNSTYDQLSMINNKNNSYQLEKYKKHQLFGNSHDYIKDQLQASKAILEAQAILFYQKQCIVYQCLALQNPDDIKFISNAQIIKLQNFGFIQKHKFHHSTGDNQPRNKIQVPFDQTLNRHGFLLKYLIKVNLSEIAELKQSIQKINSQFNKRKSNSLANISNNNNQANENSIMDIQSKKLSQGLQLSLENIIPKPVFKMKHLKNSFTDRFVLSALGLIALNQISIFILFGFIQWRISVMLSLWAIYTMIQHEHSHKYQHLAKVYLLIWFLVMYFTPNFFLSYSILNIIATFLVFLGNRFRNKHPGIYINFFWIYITISYLGNLEWIIMSTPQLIYFLYSLGAINFGQDNHTQNSQHSHPSHTKNLAYYLQEGSGLIIQQQEDVQLKIKKQLEQG